MGLEFLKSPLHPLSSVVWLCYQKPTSEIVQVPAKHLPSAQQYNKRIALPLAIIILYHHHYALNTKSILQCGCNDCLSTIMMPTTTWALSTMSCGLVEDIDHCLCTIGVVDAASTQKALLLVWSVSSNRVSPNLLANPSLLAFQSTVLMLVIRIMVNILDTI